MWEETGGVKIIGTICSGAGSPYVAAQWLNI